jgi:methionine-rich copper-binding protein CopC
MRRGFFHILLLIALLALATIKAEAHAIIMESNPASGATVSPGAIPLKLRFNSRIDHARSVLTLIDSAKQSTKLPISPESPTDMLEATTGVLGPGDYRLRWQVLSVDGHITRGDIPFTVQ